MGFGEAISTCLRKYAVFQGRARRSEFWFWVLFELIVLGGAYIVVIVFALSTSSVQQGGVSGETVYSPLTYVLFILFIILALAFWPPTISVSVRRLHDTGHSGWWWWLNLIAICAIGEILLIIFFYIQPSQPEENQYGPTPA